MKETPILFSGTMVRAILDGLKTQTRRVVKPQPDAQLFSINSGPEWTYPDRIDPDEPDWDRVRLCPYGRPGDRLWVRETWRIEPRELQRGRISHLIDYAANPGSPELTVTKHIDAGRYSDHKVRYRPSIHMPRWASRIDLENINIRVERVQDISEEDAKAEGVKTFLPPYPFPADWPRNSEGKYTPSYGTEYADDRTGFARSARDAFALLWNSINGPRGYGWDSNPWVWVVQFNRV